MEDLSKIVREEVKPSERAAAIADDITEVKIDTFFHVFDRELRKTEQGGRRSAYRSGEEMLPTIAPAIIDYRRLEAVLRQSLAIMGLKIVPEAAEDIR